MQVLSDGGDRECRRVREDWKIKYISAEFQVVFISTETYLGVLIVWTVFKFLSYNNVIQDNNNDHTRSEIVMITVIISRMLNET